eukprot:6124731-Amphidinium_carterae.1
MQKDVCPEGDSRVLTYSQEQAQCDMPSKLTIQAQRSSPGELENKSRDGTSAAEGLLQLARRLKRRRQSLG